MGAYDAHARGAVGRQRFLRARTPLAVTAIGIIRAAVAVPANACLRVPALYQTGAALALTGAACRLLRSFY